MTARRNRDSVKVSKGIVTSARFRYGDAREPTWLEQCSPGDVVAGDGEARKRSNDPLRAAFSMSLVDDRATEATKSNKVRWGSRPRYPMKAATCAENQSST